MKKLITVMLATLSIVAITSASSATPKLTDSYWTSVCCTTIGNCPTPQVAQNGTPCWCPLSNGDIIWGNAC